jgi:rSAM/selenodomain-associated transferase 2
VRATVRKCEDATVPPLVSVVIPVFRDTEAAKGLLASLPVTPEVEVIVVDGEQDEELDKYVRTPQGVRLYRTTAGRGHQMNVGAAAASGEWLLFLHADSRLPADWLGAFRALSDHLIGGWFRFALDDDAWQARILERLVSWRVRLLQLPYGDQGLFVRRRQFESMGGYREMPLFEDVEFVQRLTRADQVVELPLALRTSSRRWRGDGWIYRSAQNLVLVTMYFAGVSPAWLERRYRSGRRG